MKRLNMAITLFILLHSSIGIAETLRVIFYDADFPPYFQREAKIGIYHDMFAELAKLTHFEFKIEYFPAIRAKIMFEKNVVDIEPNINPVWRKDSAVPGVYSIAYDKSVEVLLFAGGSKFLVKKPSDLMGKDIGMVRGYVYPSFSALFQKKEIIRHDFPNEVALLEILSRGGGIKQILINKKTALYWMKVKPEYNNFEIGYEISNLDVMLRIHPNKKHVLPSINQALRQMIDTGLIARIHAKYR